MNPVPSTINPVTATGRRMAILVLVPHHKLAHGGEVTHMTLTDVKLDL
jgi:hypothetical protein